MVFILVVVIGLVAWALHLMQEAIQTREFSLMLAGFLVSSAAAAMMAVYFLMGHYVGYMSQMSDRLAISSNLTVSSEWFDTEVTWIDKWADVPADNAHQS
ncbi:MAG TPA: hypothetical protein V6C78_19010 [Crinalium sp.]|jgi:uncharacterized membrane protein YfhO